MGVRGGRVGHGARRPQRPAVAPSHPRMVCAARVGDPACRRQHRAQLLRRTRRSRRGVGVGAGPRLDDGLGRQPRTGRPRRQTLLRHRRADHGAEGELRHAHAHRHAVQHAG